MNFGGAGDEIHPMTLGNMRANGAYTLAAWCHFRSTLGRTPKPVGITIPAFVRINNTRSCRNVGGLFA
jgi:hypothetical protein